MSLPVIGFAGMTHLSINSAVATAERGFKIVCFDENSTIIEQLNNKNLPVIEPQLPELLEKNARSITFTYKINDLKKCDVVYIAPDVPTNDKGESDLSGIKKLIESVSKSLHENAILVILCQVPPGFTRNLSFPKERLYYQVETLIFGRAVDRALNPERFIIGTANPVLPLKECYQKLLEAFQCPILPMRYESAELAKISINCCLVASVGVANTLSEICEQIGADWSEIVPALKLDKRIGQFAYLSPGLGIAGGNLERDLTTVLELSKQHGTETGIVNAWIKNSRYRRDWVLRILHQYLLNKNSDPLLAVWGLAYKEDTHSTKNSPSLALLSCLESYRINVYDPAVSADIVPFAKGATSALNAASNADALIIMTPWKEFKNTNLKTLGDTMKGNIIIDPYRILDEELVREAGFKYLTLGTSIVC